MICPNCKREVPNTAKACGYCGHWLADEGEATVEVPEETAATVALPEEKGRSPWLWIGAGLAVAALVVAMGVLAFLAGRGGEGVDTEATLAAALVATKSAEATTSPEAEAVATEVPEATTPAPPTEGTSQAVVPMYDDFDDPAFDGDYDKSRWRLVSDSPGDFVQEGSVLIVTQESAAESGTRLVAREYDFVRLEAPTAFQAKLKVDPEEQAGNLHLALEAEVPEGEEWWWTECTLYEDWLGCYADLGYQPEGMSVKPGTWHTVQIDVDPATMTFTYYVDGRVEGTFVPPNAEKLKNAKFALTVGIWHDERENGMVGYIDDVRIGQFE